MKKINIIKDNKDYEIVINNRNVYKTPYFNIYFQNNNYNCFRFGIAVPKKIGKAVIRNKIKRQIKYILDKCSIVFSKKDFVIIVKASFLNLAFNEKKEFIEKAMLKITPKED